MEWPGGLSQRFERPDVLHPAKPAPIQQTDKQFLPCPHHMPLTRRSALSVDAARRKSCLLPSQSHLRGGCAQRTQSGSPVTGGAAPRLHTPPHMVSFSLCQMMKGKSTSSSRRIVASVMRRYSLALRTWRPPRAGCRRTEGATAARLAARLAAKLAPEPLARTARQARGHCRPAHPRLAMGCQWVSIPELLEVREQHVFVRGHQR